MKDEIHIESNLSDLINDDERVFIHEEEHLGNNHLEIMSIADKNTLIENNDNSLRQILKLGEDGSLEMIQMLNEN